ncbi:MAG: hypothetical protein ACI8PZ_003605 [Myxococcota bacterium]|jgi:hypothetical protein
MLVFPLTAALAATTPCGEPLSAEGPTVHLVTVGPAATIDKSFGHTSVYVQDPSAGIDTVYNYGFYSGYGPDAIRDFVLGDQRYWLQTRAWKVEIGKYRGEARSLTVQRLDLSPAAAATLVSTLAYMDDDSRRHYDYHWYASNCTTKIRDLLDAAIDGALRAQLAGPSGTTQRFEVLRHIHTVPWAWYGLSWGASARTDVELSRYEAAFLPSTLHDELGRLSLDGRPLVSRECEVLSSELPPPLPAPPNRAPLLAGIGAVWGGLVAAAPRRLSAVLLALHATLATLAGVVSVGLWALSNTEAYWANSHLFLSSPAHVVGVLAAWWIARGDRRATPALGGLLALGLVGVVAGLALGKPTVGWAAFFLLPLLGGVARAQRD